MANFPNFLSLPELVECLKHFDAMMLDENLRRQYLEPPVGDEVPCLQFEAHYRVRDYPTVGVNEVLTSILLTADCLLMQGKQRECSAALKAHLESVGYPVTMNDAYGADKWSLAKMTGRNFCFNFG